MRGAGKLIVVGVLGAASLLRVQAQAPQPDAASVLAAAREALGGEKRLSAIKGFVATGRTKQVRGNNLVPIEFEIACELPDKYVRRDEIPAQESGPTSLGFNATDLIQLPETATPGPMPPGRGGAAGPPPAAMMEAMRAGRVATVKQDFVRLTLGMFASSFPSYPLTFTYAGQAEAPQGRADVLDVTGPPPFKMRLFINSQTHLPIMVSWQAAPNAGRGMPPGMGGPGAGGGPRGGGAPGAAPAGGAAAPGSVPPTSPAPGPPATGRAAAPATEATPAATARGGAAPAEGAARGGAPAATGTQTPGTPTTGAPAGPGGGGDRGGAPAGAGGAGGRGAAPAVPVEYRIYYGDYREVNGLQWPFRLRRATGTETTEETMFDGFRINPKIDPKKFEVRK